MIQKSFITLNLDEITPYENNPRINDEAVADVVASIEQCENLDPIEVDENNVILSGHTRLKALYELGYTETECVRYTGLTEDQKRKYRILANKTAEKASWDFGKLEMELEGLDFGGFDFGIELIEEEYPDMGDLDSNDEDSENVKTVARLAFSTYKQYKMHEREIKRFADDIGASITVGK